MKKLKESGASFDQMKAKLDEFIGKIGDFTEKAKAEKVYLVLCLLHLQITDSQYSLSVSFIQF